MKYATMRLLLVLIVISASVILKTNAARILCVFPTPSFSHQVVYRSLTAALAQHGHDVVVITTHPFPPGKSPANLTEIDVYEVSHRIWREGISRVYHVTGDEMNIASTYFTMFKDLFENQIRSKPVQDLIINKKAKFDLLILESNVLATLGLINLFDAPVIQTSTFGPMLGTYDMLGAPSQPFLYPTSVHLRFYNLSIWEKLNNLYKTVTYTYAKDCHEREVDEMLQRNFGLDILPLSKLYERVSVFAQSVYPMWMSNAPVPRSIVYLGGLHQKPPKNLPQKLQTFLDSSGRGVIYVSFGSNVHSSLLSQDKINMMERVFSKIPYEVLWKRDQDVQSNVAKNIQISTWFPQSDLLYHPKIKLFISQGGLQSTEEAITAGVPLIGIPIFGDQWMHTENYVRHRIGLQLDWNTLSEEQLTRSIANVVEDNSYKENVIRLRDVMNDQPQSASERAVWWTDYILKHGDIRHLSPASANISWLQYYEVELIGIVVIIIGIVFKVLGFIVFRFVDYICTITCTKKRCKII